MNTSRLYLLTLLVLFAFGCRKESIISDKVTTIPSPTIFIESEIVGLVTNQNGEPIEDAEVNWGSNLTTTDQNGFFKIISTVPDRIVVLNIKKENYFEANQTLSPLRENTIHTKVQLIERTLSGSFSSTSGGIINVSGGGKVDFAANGFKTESGNNYTGEINVYTTYLDPTRSDLREVMPGNLTALNLSEELQYLKSFGMINVELEGSAGEKLQISQAASLTVPVPNLLSSDAPNTIPLWHFDTESGLWEEEGEATLQGNEYVGEVSHFSWWNCDDNIETVFLQGQVNILNGPATIDVRIVRPDGTSCTVTTSGSGNISGHIPKNELLTLELIDVCGDIVYSEDIGPFNLDNINFVITVDLSNLELVTFSGAALNCNGQPVTNGYGIVNGIGVDFSFIIPIENTGNFSTDFYKCEVETVSVVVADIDEETQSTPQVFTVEENLAIGNIDACEDDIAGFQVIINNVEDSFITPCTAILSTNPNGATVYNISFQSVQSGGNVNYYINIHDNNNDPTNPVYTYAWGILNLDGTPECQYSSLAVSTINDIVKLSSNETIGDNVHFHFNNVDLTKDCGTPTIFNDVEIDIKATIIQ
ncbi:MAG: hypothetical protein AB8H03_13010 [Saprospiraceae bacterium]